MKKLLALTICVCLVSSLSYCQFFERLYSTIDYYSLTSIQHEKLNDSSFYFTGYDYSGLLFLGIDNDVQTVTTRLTGFDKSFDLIIDSSYAYTVGETIVGDTVLGDIVYSLTNVLLIKTKLNGDTVWTKQYKYKTLDRGRGLVKSGDTIVISALSGKIDKNEIGLMYLDTLGNLIKAFELDLFVSTEPGEKILKLLLTKDKNLVLLYNDNETYPSVKSHLIKVDFLTGQILWHYTTDSYCNEVKLLDDNGFILAGTKDQKVYSSKINFSGQFIWEKNYDITDFSGAAWGLSVLEDQSFIISGDNQLHQYSRIGNSFLAKCSKDGELIWYNDFGVGFVSCLNSVSAINNGYYASGVLSDTGVMSLFVVKADLNGNIDTSYITNIKELVSTKEEINIYPNPSNGFFNINISNSEFIKELTFYNIKGQEVKRIYNYKNDSQIIINNINEAMLIVKIITIKNEFIFKKVLIYK